MPLFVFLFFVFAVPLFLVFFSCHFEKENEHAHNEEILARAFLPVPRLPIFLVSAQVKKKRPGAKKYKA